MLEFIMEQHERTGEPLPEKIANAPKLNAGLEFFMKAFIDLGTCRTMNGTIPFTAVEEYCQLFDITGTQKEDLHSHLRSMDVASNKFSEKNRGSKYRNS